MPTLAATLGKTLDLFVKAESTFGTAATGNYLRTLVYNFGMRASKGLEDDPLLGVTRNNDRDATAPAPGLLDHGGSIEAPMDLNHFGYWASLLMGAPSTSESTGVFTHVFTSGKLVLPSWTIEEQIGAEFVQHLGVVGRTMQFGMGPSPGYRRIGIELGARDEDEIGSTGAGTPAAALARLPIANVIGELLVDDVAVANLLGFQATYDTALEPERFVDGGDKVSAWSPGDRDASFTGEMNLRWLDNTWTDLGIAGAAHSMTARWALSSDARLVLTMPAVTFARSGPPIAGPGRLEQRVPFRAAQTASAPMLTATLKNGISVYTGAH